MKNRMQDLDFEQNVAFDKVQEYEFTRRAAQRFRQVVSLDSFEDEDADVIFHYLYKEMELVSFGDHLKRYIYERAELEEPFSEVPQEVYKEIVVDSFKETYTPKSMNPTSTKLSALVNNWLNQASVKRETVFLLGFGLKMTTEDVSDFLTRVLKEQDFDFYNPDEVIYWYCYSTQQGYHKAEELKKKYEILAPVEVENTHGSESVLSLKNYSNDNSEQADYEGFYALSISYFKNSEEERLKDPQTYTGIEGIKYLEINTEIQKKAEEQGIDWYEIWPDLEDVVVY